MVRFVRLCFGMLVRLFRGRQSLLLENLALRQQLVMLKRRLLLEYVRYHQRTARISDLRRGHLRTEFVPKLPVGTFHRNDSEGCTIVTIERHSSDRLSAGPSYMRIYARSTRTGLAPLGSSCCTESIIVFTPTPPEPPRFEPRLKFWRTTAPSFGEAQRMDASEQLSTLFLSIWKTKSG